MYSFFYLFFKVVFTLVVFFQKVLMMPQLGFSDCHHINCSFSGQQHSLCGSSFRRYPSDGARVQFTKKVWGKNTTYIINERHLLHFETTSTHAIITRSLHSLKTSQATHDCYIYYLSYNSWYNVTLHHELQDGQCEKPQVPWDVTNDWRERVTSQGMSGTLPSQ